MTMEKHNTALLPALAAVMGAVSLDSAALGPGGAAAAAVPALLSASLVEGSAGLVEAASAPPPCGQCLGAVLNKLARGPELDSAVALVVEALTADFAAVRGSGKAGGGGRGSGGGSGGDVGAMDVEGVAAEREEGFGETPGPVQCLAWAVKAVAMRGGLAGAFSALLDLLCGLLLVREGTP